MIDRDAGGSAKVDAAAHDAPLHDRQDDHGQDRHAAPAEQVAAVSAPWAPMQARAMSRHSGPLASRMRTPPAALPYRAELENQFGRSLDGIEVHVGESAAVQGLGARGAAEGDVVAFADAAPDRETVAHEVTHVLQARSGNAGTHAGAEAEANDAKANVAAGRPIGPITEGATGVHLDTGTQVNSNDGDVSAREFLKTEFSVQTIALAAIRLSGATQKHHMSPFIHGDLYGAIFDHPLIAQFLQPFDARIDGLVAPDPVDAIVDKARAARMQFGVGVGPAHHVYIDSVGVALGNAITRKLQLSISRMLPRVVLASKPRKLGKDAQGGDWWTDDGPPAASSLVVSHPMDRVVALGLCSSDIKIDTGKFLAGNPELVKDAADHVRAPRSTPITIRFPWERNLWHWVEASVPDATAEEVAKLLFGAEDQAYRLSSVPPLFGFRGSDVEAFVPEKKKELNDLAAAHHPSPKIANQGEIAAITNSHTEAERVQQIRDASRRPGQIDLNDPRFNGPMHTGVSGGTDFGMPGGTDFGFPRVADMRQQQQPEHGQPKPQPPAPIKVFPIEADVDPAAELAESEGGEQLTKDRAKLAATDGKHHDQAAVYERIGDCLDLIEPTKRAFTSLGIATTFVDKHLARFQSLQARATQMSLSDPDSEYPLIDQQANVLKSVSKTALDAAAHLPLYGGVNKNDDGAVTPKIADLPDFAKGPMQEAARALEEAVSALAFPELARPRCAQAEYLTKMLRVAVLEQSLHQTRPILQGAMDTPNDRHADTADYDPSKLSTVNGNLLMELARTRVELEHDPGKAEKDFAETQERAGDYTFEIAVISNLEALDSVWGAIEDSEDFWKSGFDTMVGDGLQWRNRLFYEKFKKDVYDKYQKGVDEKSKTKKEEAKKAFKDLLDNEEFKTHFAMVQSHLKDTAKHKRWTKIAVGIAIAVVAMGLGQVYFGAALAAGGSLLGTAITAAVIETGTGAILNKLIFDADPTAGSLIVGMLGATAMYSILGQALITARAAGASAEVAGAVEKASLLQKAGKLTGDLTREMLLVQAIGMVQGEAINLIDHGKLLSEEQLKEMFVHNIAGLVGMKIGQRIIDVHLDPMKPMRELGRKSSLNIDALEAERKELITLSETVKNTTDPATRKVLAEQLVAREKAFLENVRETRDRLIELAEKHPGQFSAAKLKDLKAMPERVQDAETIQAEAMMSLEEIGPNLYRADAKAFDAVLALHKQAGDKLVAVHTDPNTGLRSLEFSTPDGAIVKIKEKLGDIGDRNAPPVPAAEAKRFEDWLETAPLNPDPVVASTQRQRLRDYYARDPQGAMHIAEGHGFLPQSMPDTAVLAPKPGKGVSEQPTVKPKSEADRAFDQHLNESVGEGPQMSRVGEEPMMNRSDFEAMYKAGFEYDPVTRKWVLADGKVTRAGGTLPPASGKSQVLGPVHSEAVGSQVLRKLVFGEAEALRLMGIEPPPGFDPRTTEWGLGRRKSDGEVVLVRGDAGEVNWGHIPEIEPLAHSHPLIDPMTGQARTISGKGNVGEIKASNPLELAATATHDDLVWFLPSTGDLRFVAFGGKAHSVMTPFVHLGEGRIGNPRPGMNADTVDIHIVSAEAIGTYGGSGEGSMIVYKGKVKVMAGDHEIGSYDIYQAFHGGLGDLPSLIAPPHTALPANHPLTKVNNTPTSTSSTPVGQVQPITLAHLETLDVRMTEPLKETLGSLDTESARRLNVLAEAGMQLRVEGIPEWLTHLESKGGKDLSHAMLDLEAAVKALERDPSLKIVFEKNGSVRFVDTAKPVGVSVPPKDAPTIINEVKQQIAGDKDFEWRFSDVDAARVVTEGRRLGLSDAQINDLLRIAQRKDQEHPNPNGGDPITVKKHITADELIQQMHNYVETVLPQGHPYRIENKEKFLEFANQMREAAHSAGLPADDIRVQGSALRNPDARDIDVAIVIDERAFDAQLVKTFESRITRESHGRVEDVPLSIEGLEGLVREINADADAGRGVFNWQARTLARAYENRTIRSQDVRGFNAAKKRMARTYGDLDITIMSNRGYLNREPFMVLPQ